MIHLVNFAVHLGQNRFMREKWMLNKTGGVYTESSPLVLQEDNIKKRLKSKKNNFV
jgi:hypothetical protein